MALLIGLSLLVYLTIGIVIAVHVEDNTLQAMEGEFVVGLTVVAWPLVFPLVWLGRAVHRLGEYLSAWRVKRHYRNRH